MLIKRQEAAACATARENKQLNKSYRNSVSDSREKLQIGEFLLYLQQPLSQIQQKKGWALFELKLKQYVDLKYCEVAI